MSIPVITPYAMPSGRVKNRVDWRPDPARAVLLVHDMQEYFLAKYDMAQAPIPTLVAHTQQLRAACDTVGVPVVFTAQPVDQPAGDRALLNDFWGPGLTAPDKHAQQPIIAALKPGVQDTVLTKWRYSAFQRSNLRELMREWGRDQLIICGIYAHIGCMATALEAFMQDVQPFFVLDAVADFSAAEHQMAITYVSGRCGASLTVDEVLDALSAQPQERSA